MSRSRSASAERSDPLTPSRRSKRVSASAERESGLPNGDKSASNEASLTTISEEVVISSSTASAASSAAVPSSPALSSASARSLTGSRRSKKAEAASEAAADHVEAPKTNGTRRKSRARTQAEDEISESSYASDSAADAVEAPRTRRTRKSVAAAIPEESALEVAKEQSPPKRSKRNSTAATSASASSEPEPAVVDEKASAAADEDEEDVSADGVPLIQLSDGGEVRVDEGYICLQAVQAFYRHATLKTLDKFATKATKASKALGQKRRRKVFDDEKEDGPVQEPHPQVNDWEANYHVDLYELRSKFISTDAAGEVKYAPGYLEAEQAVEAKYSKRLGASGEHYEDQGPVTKKHKQAEIATIATDPELDKFVNSYVKRVDGGDSPAPAAASADAKGAAKPRPKAKRPVAAQPVKAKAAAPPAKAK